MLLKNLSHLRKKLCIEVISIESVPVSEIMNLYFEQSPPFSVKKKSEFPDAIFLLAIEQRVNSNFAIIISAAITRP